VAKTEYNSSVTNLGQPHVKDTTNFANGWRLPDNSQFLSKAVSLPGDIPPVTSDYDGDARPASGSAVGADIPASMSGVGAGGDGGGSAGDDSSADGGSTDGDSGDDGSTDGVGDGGNGDGNAETIARVQFITLDVLHQDNNVSIIWEATNEDDVDSYVLQRSTDEENFIRLGSIEKVPDLVESQRYEFNDEDLPRTSETLFYRIKNIYRDRSITYSPVATVSIMLPENFGIQQNYPNPASGLTQIDYTVPAPAGVRIVL
jgi:hypothetical protein